MVYRKYEILGFLGTISGLKMIKSGQLLMPLCESWDEVHKICNCNNICTNWVMSIEPKQMPARPHSAARGRRAGVEGQPRLEGCSRYLVPF